MPWLEGAVRVGLGDLPGEFSHERDYDEDYWHWEPSLVECDRYALCLEGGRLEVYIGVHPSHELPDGEPFEALQVDGHRGLSRRVVRRDQRFREIFFLPSSWVHLFYEARSDEVAALFDEAIAQIQIDADGELRGMSRVQQGRGGLFARAEAQPTLVPTRDVVALPGTSRQGSPLEASANELDFGSVLVGEALSIPLQLLGEGEIVAASWPDGFVAYDRFGSRFADDPLELPFSLHGAEVLTLTFRPRQAGQHAGAVCFRTADGRETTIRVAALATAGEQPKPFPDNETLVEMDSSELPATLETPTPDNPIVVRMIESTNELCFGNLSFGERSACSLCLRNLEERRVPVAFGGALDLKAEGRTWFWVDFGDTRERVSKSGVLWLEPAEELGLAVRCHCRRNALLAPTTSLAIATPSGTSWMYLRFYYEGETSWHTYGGGWGYGATDSHEGILAELDPELNARVHQRMLGSISAEAMRGQRPRYCPRSAPEPSARRSGHGRDPSGHRTHRTGYRTPSRGRLAKEPASHEKVAGGSAERGRGTGDA